MPFILYTWQEIALTLPRFTGSQEKNTALKLAIANLVISSQIKKRKRVSWSIQQVQ